MLAKLILTLLSNVIIPKKNCILKIRRTIKKYILCLAVDCLKVKIRKREKIYINEIVPSQR